MHRKEYINSDQLCYSIVNNFDVLGNTEEWLIKYMPLFNRFNIQVGTLPAIADSNFEGIKYENIAKFHRLYQKLNFEYHILDYKSHVDAIVYFFEQMNASMLASHMKEMSYLGMDNADFFYSLGNAFQVLQNRGNKQLYTEVIECSFCSQKQYFFKGYKDDSYLHLIFKLENGMVKDLIECREAKCDLPAHIDTENQVFLDIITPPF